MKAAAFKAGAAESGSGMPERMLHVRCVCSFQRAEQN